MQIHLPTHAKFHIEGTFLSAEVLAIRFAGGKAPYATLTQRDVISAWKNDEEFREFFSNVITSAPFEAVRWETSPIRCDDIDRPFESVLVASRALAAVAPDPAPFEDHIGAGVGSNGIATFANLGRDARLIVPCASIPHAQFAHLTAFLRTAPHPQIHRLWQAVSQGIEDIVESKVWPRIWVSTAGLGVSWLHIRLDANPKYYHHRPFALAT
jgi:hypothetical protein